MLIYLIRHGETLENVRSIVQGHSVGTLSDKGVAQAQALANAFKETKLDAIYSSDLRRATDTVRYIHAFHECPLIFDQRLREKCHGVLEGRLVNECKDLFDRCWDPNLDYKIEDGESFSEMQQRISSFWLSLTSTTDVNTALIMTHGGAIRCLWSLLGIMSLDQAMRTPIENTSMTVLEVVNGNLHSWRVNEIQQTESGH